MGILRFLLLAVFLTVVPRMADAFESRALDATAKDYEAAIAKEFAGQPGDTDAAFAALQAAGKSDWQAAVRHYERSIAANPDYGTAWLGLALAWMKVDPRHGKAPEAAYRGYRVAQTPEARAQALTVLGAALEGAKEYRSAIKAFEESHGLVANAGTEEKLLRLVHQHGFRALGVDVNSDTDNPEFCVKFRGNLGKDKRIRFEDYLRITPSVPGGVAVRGNSLCVEGVSHGDAFEIAVLAGLPAADGSTTRASATFTATIGNRSPSVAFQGGTYVLPRTGATGVPVITVNVDRVRLKILHINERNLIHEINEGHVTQLFGPWNIGKIEDSRGHVVWEGEMDVDGKTNDRVTTAIPIGDVLKSPAPGVYILIAESVDHKMDSWENRATQWLVVSDIGLATIKGRDGLHVFARSLETGRPKADVAVSLFGRDNGLLGTLVTGADGMVRLDAGLLRGTGGRTPKALYATAGGGDFTFLDLTAPAFDLSDRGVGGRATPGPIDVFLYADRGVYRRGETAHVVALMRDDKATAVEGMPLTVRILRPDGAEAQRHALTGDSLGAHGLDVAFSPGAQTGRWTVQAHIDPDAEPIGTLRLLVEDVVPPRIEVKMTTNAKTLVPGAAATVTAQADYLYGAPGAGLPAEAELVVLEDKTPYPGFGGYRFGLAEEKVRPKRTPLAVDGTDGKGALSLDVVLETVPDTTLPLKAVIRAGVFEMGGRPATASLTVPVRQRANAVGLRPRFGKAGKDLAVGEGQEAGFDVVVLDRDGAPADGALRYSFVQEDWTYQWFLHNGAWDYEISVIDKPLGGGSLGVTADKPATLAHPVTWGRYRLEVHDPKTGAASSVRFRAGWFVAPTAADTPDKLELVVDKTGYRPGEMAKVHVKPPFAGEVLLAVANDRVLYTRALSVPAAGTTVEIPFAGDWGVGAYVLATAFRPDTAERGPGRAIGVAWLGMDRKPRTLDIAIDAPAEATPDGGIDIPVTVTGLDAGKPAFVTLAAVDEGVLGLTGFKTPDPAGHYYAKRRLGVAVRDLFGRLIDGKAGRRGRVRSGGGDPRLAGRGAPPVDAGIVSLFSGLVPLDAKGRAIVHLDIPQYNGRLRLMAVAFDATRMGAAEAPLPVREPLIAQLSRPRFLAPGDESYLTLVMDNLSAPSGDYTASIAGFGNVTVSGEGEFKRTLAPGQSTSGVFGISGMNAGTGKLVMTIEGPEGFRLERSWSLAVRPAQFAVTRRIARNLEPGQKVTYSDRLTEEFLPGTGEVLLSFSPRPDLDVPGVLRALDRYPYGCLEQTTSRALPLLYVGEVAGLWGGKGAEAGTRPRIQKAIQRVLDMQRSDGGFSLWNSTGPAEPWLTAYVMDFLIRAKIKGHEVPDFAYRGGLRWLQNSVQSLDGKSPDDIVAMAYAFYVLAAAGAGEAGPLRYFADRFADGMPGAMATAQLGAALAMQGEWDRARFHFGKAAAAIGKRAAMRDYGTLLRDNAALVALTSETAEVIADVQRDWGARSLPAVVEDLAARQAATEYTSPQENAWMLMAAAALAKDQGDMVLDVDGTALAARAKPLYVRPGDTRLAAGLTYGNGGNGVVWHTATVTGVPRDEEPALQNGFTLERSFLTMDGKPANLEEVRQNDVLVVVIGGSATSTLDHQALIVDLLPAGFEIENARLDHGRSTEELEWIPALSKTRHVEFRDDRFVAAIDLAGRTRSFAVAYLARAVTPGHYKLPAAHIEDMYKPQYRARTAMGSVYVTTAR
jgi:alpha-2-macroglobulin